MEGIQHSLHKNPASSKKLSHGTKPVYDDVFGGPPKYGVSSFSTQINDYAEIFGGLYSPIHTNIPVLDLPSFDDGTVASSFDTHFDYSEIFGGFHGDELAISYEDLFQLQNPTIDRRNLEESLCRHVQEPFGDSSNGFDRGLFSFPSKNKEPINGISHVSCDGKHQFNISYHKTNLSCKEDMAIGLTTRTTHLDAVSGFTCIVDECPPHLHNKSRINKPLSRVSDHTITSEEIGDIIVENPTAYVGGPATSINSSQEVERPPNKNSSNPLASSNVGKISRNDDQGGQEHLYYSKSNISVHNDYQFHNSSNDDQKCENVRIHHQPEVFLTVSEINLRTQPSQVPPPSRPPPKLAYDLEEINRREDGSSHNLSKKIFTHPLKETSGNNIVKATAKDKLPSLFNLEALDASSDAAVSAAAMKEAMEQAQIRLKSAKESMERKKESSQTRSKLHLNEVYKAKKKRDGEIVQNFWEEFDERTCERKNSDKSSSKEGEVALEISSLTSSSIENESHFGITNGIIEKTMKGFATIQESHKPDEKVGEWREEKQYYELVKPGKKSKVAYEVHELQKDEREPRNISKFAEHHDQNESTSEHVQLCDPEENLGKLGESKEVNEIVGKRKKVKSIQEAQTREVENNTDTDQECHGWEKTARYLGTVRQQNEQEQAKITVNFVEEMQKGEDIDNKVKLGQEVNKENHPKSEAFHELGEEKAKDKWLEAAQATSVIKENEEKLKLCTGCGDFEKNEKAKRMEMPGSDHLSSGKENREKKQYQETHQHKKPFKNVPEAWYSEPEENNLESSKEACIGVTKKEFEESLKYGNEQNKSKSTQETCKQEDNEKKLNVDQVDHEQKKCKTLNTQERKEDRTRLSPTDHERKDCKGKLNVTQEVSVRKKGGIDDDRISNNEKMVWSIKEGDYELKAYQELNEKKLHADENTYHRVINGHMLQTNKKVDGSKSDKKFRKNQDITHKIRERVQESDELVKDTTVMSTPEFCKPIETSPAWNASVQGNIENVNKIQEAEGFSKDEEESTGGSGEGHVLKESLTTREPAKIKVKNAVQTIEKTISVMKHTTESEIFTDIKESHNDFKPSEDVDHGIEKLIKTGSDNKGYIQKKVLESGIDLGRKDNSVDSSNGVEEREDKDKRQKKTEEERERKNVEDEKEREREREKDRIAVERVTRETREREERVTLEKVVGEARERVTGEKAPSDQQRTIVNPREKDEKLGTETREKLLAEKKLVEARLKTERAAVERATAEARERAAEKAAAEARGRFEKSSAQKLSANLREKQRREYDMEGHSEDTQGKTNENLFHGAAPSSDFPKYSNSTVVDDDSAKRGKAIFERHQRTVERAAKALAEKNLRDIVAQKEQAERNRLSETLDAEVRRWSNGKEGNLRALLSTLQYILGPDSGWQPIPLIDVVTAPAVKKAYRKATLYVHPDKLQQRGASIQQKYICEKVFDLLKDAWNKFNSEER